MCIEKKKQHQKIVRIYEQERSVNHSCETSRYLPERHEQRQRGDRIIYDNVLCGQQPEIVEIHSGVVVASTS